MTNFDPNTFRSQEEIDLTAVRNRPPKTPPRHRKGEEFLKGPIPWAWLVRAMSLPGKAMSIALVLWKEAGIRNRRTVKINLSALADLGLTRGSARRGLKALESAKLVTVTHRPGQALEVMLLDALTENLDA